MILPSYQPSSFNDTHRMLWDLPRVPEEEFFCLSDAQAGKISHLSAGHPAEPGPRAWSKDISTEMVKVKPLAKVSLFLDMTVCHEGGGDTGRSPQECQQDSHGIKSSFPQPHSLTQGTSSLCDNVSISAVWRK